MRAVRGDGGDGRRTRGGKRRPGALAALAVCGMLALTACQGNEDPGASGAKPATPPSTPSATATASAAPASAAPSAPASKPAAKPTASAAKKPSSPKPTATCDHKMPIAPDLIALRRYTPEGGSHNLIVRHGNWSCGTPDTDGAAFEPVGKETFIPIAESAMITATAPIVAGAESKTITLHELIGWVTAHPDSGLPFRYHLGADGAIDTLDEIYLP